MSIDYDIPRLLRAIDRFPNVRILVVGDIMLDEFVWGSVRRISPEAPVPVVEVNKETRLLGGAANVINNLVSVGGRATLAGVVGDDAQGMEIREMVRRRGVNVDGIITDPGRPTTIKTRIVAQGQQVVRFDREKRNPLGPDIEARLHGFIKESAAEVDAVIVSDYGKGLVGRDLLERILLCHRSAGRIVAVDPIVKNFPLYRGISLITPNHLEAALGSGVEIDSEETLRTAGRKILEELECESVLITRGEHGMALFERASAGRPINIPTVAREVFDVTGAGDTVIAILVLGLAVGLSMVEAAILANFAAGVVVGEVGTSAVAAERLRESVANGTRILRRTETDPADV